jgi:ribonuclease P/MRP protein subunit POP5
MANLKPLMPSLKERKRYVVFSVESSADLPPEKIFEAIQRACLDFMGLLNSGKAGVMILKNQFSGNKGIIRVSHRFVNHVKASLALITCIDKTQINITAIGVSGILKKAREKFINEKVNNAK